MKSEAPTNDPAGGAAERAPRSAGPRLSTRRAFVLQVSVESPLERRRIDGRIEHVESGRARRFVGLDEMLAFVAATLERLPERHEHEQEGRER